MQVRVYSSNLDINRELRDHVERRISFALDRMSKHVNWVGIRLGDLSSARPANKQCTIQISLDGGATLSVEHFDSSILESVVGAADRAAKAVSRHLAESPTPPYRRHAGDLGHFESPSENVEVRHLDRLHTDVAGRRNSEEERDRSAAPTKKALLT